MKSLHMGWMWLALLAAPLSALAAPQAGYHTPPGWRTECIGRVQFDVPGDIAWHLVDYHWGKPFFDDPQPNPTITPGEKQLAYGEGLTPGHRYLVNIAVSPLTEPKVFEYYRYIQTLGRGEAQERVVQGQIDALDTQYDQSKGDQRAIEALLRQQRDLKDTLKRIGYVHSQLIMIDDILQQFRREGRPVDKLQAEYDAYFKEQAQWPTDAQFEQERFIELDLPDAFAHWHDNILVAYLFRDQRLYRFEFQGGPGALDTSDALTPLEPKARAVLAAFRTRAQYEIPKDNGFCIPYGFIADDGTPRHGITLGFTPVDNPRLLHRLSMSDDGEKAVDMLPMLLARLIANPFPQLMSVDKFGPSRVQIGAAKGRIGGARYRPFLPDTSELSPIETFKITAGSLSTEFQPTVMLSVINEHSDPPLEFEPSKAAFLTTLESVRALPGGHRFEPVPD